MSDFEALAKTWFGEGMNKARLLQRVLARLNAEELPDDIRDGICNLGPDAVNEIEEALPYVTSFDELRACVIDPEAIDFKLLKKRDYLISRVASLFGLNVFPSDIIAKIRLIDLDGVQNLHMALNYFFDFDDFVRNLDNPNAINLDVMNARCNLRKNLAEKLNGKRISKAVNVKIDKLDKDALRKLYYALPYLRSLDEFKVCLAKPGSLDLDALRARHDLRMDAAIKFNIPELGEAIEEKMRQMDIGSLQSARHALLYLRSFDELKVCLAKPESLDLDALRARHDLRMDAAIKFNVSELGEAIEEKMSQMDTGSLQSARNALPYLRRLDEFKVCLAKPGSLDLDALRARHDLRMDEAIKFKVPELGEAIEEKMRKMDAGSLQMARNALPYVSSLDEFAVCLDDPANPLFMCRKSLTFMLQRKLGLEKLPNDMAFLVNNADLVTIIEITSQIVAVDRIDKIKAVLGKY
jgi:hypothetical protein